MPRISQDVFFQSENGNNAFKVAPIEHVVSLSSLALTADQLFVVRFFLSMQLKVSKVAFFVDTGAVAGVISAGIYNAGGTVKLIDTGALTATASGVKTKTLTTPVILTPGFYLAAWASNNTALLIGATDTSGNFQTLRNQFVEHGGTVAGAAVGGVLPAAVGTVVAAGFAWPLTLLQG